MYQTLICRIVRRERGCNQSCRLSAPFYAQLVECSANALVDGMGADSQPGCDFLAVVMLVNQQQAFDLAVG